MKNAERTVSVILFAAMLLAAGQSLASCGSEAGDEKNTETQTQTQTETQKIEEKDYFADRLLVDDGVPTEDYHEAVFRFLTSDGDLQHLLLDEGTGEVVGDAIAERTSTVEERFNIHFEGTERNYLEVIKTLNASIMSGDDEYALINLTPIETCSHIRENLFLNWYDIPHIDFTKPWWYKSNIDDLTCNGVTFVAVGPLDRTVMRDTEVFFFNKSLAAEYDMPDMYELVNSGKWTADKLISLVKDVYRDLDGDGKINDTDLFGYAGQTDMNMNVFQWAFGGMIVKRQNDGTLVLDYYNEKAVDAYAKMRELFYQTNGSFTMDYSGHDVTGMFMNNQVLFVAEPCGFAESLRNFETDYGIIPYPKLNEDQKDYYTVASGGFHVYSVPTSVKDTEFVGSVVEVLMAESWKHLAPAYYDVVLKVKGTRDETSVSMLDYIFDHVIFDFGFFHGGWYGVGFWPQYIFQDKNGDIASYYASKHKSFDKIVTKLINYYEDYEG